MGDLHLWIRRRNPETELRSSPFFRRPSPTRRNLDTHTQFVGSGLSMVLDAKPAKYELHDNSASSCFHVRIDQIPVECECPDRWVCWVTDLGVFLSTTVRPLLAARVDGVSPQSSSSLPGPLCSRKLHA